MPTTRHLVLVHGLSQGAWCWYKVVSHLKSSGYQVTAVDLGGCGVQPSRLEEVATFSDYIQPLIRVLESFSVNERVVLVGHSYGGLAISLAMERFSHIVSVAVFVASYMPNSRDPPALQIKQYFDDSKPEMMKDCKFTFKNGSPMTVELGDDYMATVMYHNCQPEDLELAKMLARPSGFFLEDMSKESLLTNEKYGSISKVYVVCEGDRVMSKEFQSFIVKDSPPDEVKLVPGADHMIMLTKHEDLAIYLQEVATRFP